MKTSKVQSAKQISSSFIPESLKNVSSIPLETDQDLYDSITKRNEVVLKAKGGLILD